MNALRELQRSFQRHVLRGTGTIEDQVVSTAGVDAATRLAIYTNAYRLRLTEALQSDYETLHTLLGDDEFDRLLHRYIEHYVSSDPNIRWFGGQMPRFLKETAPYLAHPVLTETACFEWTLIAAFDAADSLSIDTDTVMRIPAANWPKMRPVLDPSVQRLQFDWNTVEIWRALQAGETPPEPTALSTPADWVVWRQGLQPHFRSLEIDEAWALDAVMAERTFGELCEGLCEWIDPQHVGNRAAVLLKGWITEGMISTIRTVEPPNLNPLHIV